MCTSNSIIVAPLLPLSTARVFDHLPTYQNNSSVKERLLSANQGSNSQPHNYQVIMLIFTII